MTTMRTYAVYVDSTGGPHPVASLSTTGNKRDAIRFCRAKVRAHHPARGEVRIVEPVAGETLIYQCHSETAPSGRVRLVVEEL